MNRSAATEPNPGAWTVLPPEAAADALTHPCPSCGAKARRPCKDRSGDALLLGGIHVARRNAEAEAITKPAVDPVISTPCPKCDARPGEPCSQTYGGRMAAGLFHRARRQAATTPATKEQPAERPALQGKAALRAAKALMRGLDQSSCPPPEEPEVLAVPGFPIDRIDLADNVRSAPDPEALASLSQSIEEHGLLQPVVLTPGAKGRQILLSGYRRLAAAKLAGWTEIPAVCYRVAGSRARVVAQLVENLQREELSAIDQAQAFEQLAAFGLTDAAIGAAVHKSRAWVNNRRRLLALPPEVREMVARREVTIEDGLALLTVADPAECLARAEAMAKGRLRGKDLWALARAANGTGQKGGEASPVLHKTGPPVGSPEWREQEAEIIEEMIRSTPPAESDQIAPTPTPAPPQAPEEAPASNTHQIEPQAPMPSPRTLAREAARMLKAVEARRREAGDLLRDPKAVAVIVQRVLSGTRLVAVNKMLNRLAKEFYIPLTLLKGELDIPAEETLALLATMPPEDQLQLAFWALIEEEAGLYEGPAERMRRGPWYAGEGEDVGR